jgi:hypothetical protein
MTSIPQGSRNSPVLRMHPRSLRSVGRAVVPQGFTTTSIRRARGSLRVFPMLRLSPSTPQPLGAALLGSITNRTPWEGPRSLSAFPMLPLFVSLCLPAVLPGSIMNKTHRVALRSSFVFRIRLRSFRLRWVPWSFSPSRLRRLPRDLQDLRNIGRFGESRIKHRLRLHLRPCRNSGPFEGPPRQR